MDEVAIGGTRFGGQVSYLSGKIADSWIGKARFVVIVRHFDEGVLDLDRHESGIGDIFIPVFSGVEVFENVLNPKQRVVGK